MNNNNHITDIDSDPGEDYIDDNYSSNGRAHDDDDDDDDMESANNSGDICSVRKA
jgi:hypothetical protein